MLDGTGANRDEIHRAIDALTRGELLKLKGFAAFRMRGLGRACCGRTWEDLLGEANLAILQGAANNGTGRRWNRDVDFVTQLIGAMRSISSHWKRDFDDEEADPESEILTPTGSGRVASLDNAVSNVPSQEREIAARQQWNLIAERFRCDPAAKQVLEGLSEGLKVSEIIETYKLSRSEYRQTLKRIRLRIRETDHF
jgi:hypothetical protein